MSSISTHVLDTAHGRPAAGVPVTLSRDGAVIGRGITDADGRLRVVERTQAGAHRITFDTAALSTFYPEVSIDFVVAGDAEHYHVPLLISPFGYSTYRGS
ncbi:MAG: hydroxyisourate hydrolase [Actinomycetota bacterium]|nr:hydroxyisourate hydrolase [Actinomycetota bacterium]